MRVLGSIGLLLAFVIGFAAPARAQAAVSTAHPLDPLSSAEITRAIAILKAARPLSPDTLFPLVALHEPPKRDVLAWTRGPFSRQAAIVVLDRAAGRTSEAVVDLHAGTLASFVDRPGVQPAITVVEFDEVPKIVRANAEWQAAIRKRGIADPSKVMVDPWAPGLIDPEHESSSVRWVRALAYMKDVNKNGYARPIEGVVAVVNMNTKQVDRVIDLGMHPIPPEIGDLDEKSIGRQRVGPTPLRQVQPNGPSFTVRGQEVRWQKWRFRFAIHPREGVVLHTVGYEDGGRVRPVIYRASLRMLVPMRILRPTGISGMRSTKASTAWTAHRLARGRHRRAAPRAVLHGDVADDRGVPFRPRVRSRSDDGACSGSTSYYNKKTDSRRARGWCSSIVTVGNCDCHWIFRQDGSLELQVVLTGIMLAKGVDVKTEDDHSQMNGGRVWHLVSPYVAAPHHQHFFNFRLDMDVDGPANRVMELNVNAVPRGSANPMGNSFVMQETPLLTEQAAKRDLDLASSRRWGVFNPSVTNALGQPAGYVLVPGDNSVPYLDAQSPVRQRAGFIEHHFWATPYDAEEMHGAGEYPNQSVPGEGLVKWTAANRSLDNQDVVIWYTFAPTHIPRVEEWPVMSATTVGFKLVPVGFFSRNPALDVPKERSVVAKPASKP